VVHIKLTRRKAIYHLPISIAFHELFHTQIACQTANLITYVLEHTTQMLDHI